MSLSALPLQFTAGPAQALDADGQCNIIFENCYTIGIDGSTGGWTLPGFNPYAHLPKLAGINPYSDPLTYDGAFVLDATDVELPSIAAQKALQYRFSRHYDSRSSQVMTVLGHGWRHNYDQYIQAPIGLPEGLTTYNNPPWYCDRYETNYPEECTSGLAPLPPQMDPVAHDNNKDVFLVLGTTTQRFHLITPEDANGVTIYRSHPDNGSRLEFHRGENQGSEFRLSDPVAGVTRIYRPLSGTIGQAYQPQGGPGGAWQDRPTDVAKLGYYLAEIRNDSNQRMAFVWEVIPIANQLTTSVSSGGHGLPEAIGRLRTVVDTTGREIFYHYRDATPQSDDGSAFPELSCVSLHENAETCNPQNAGTIPALVSFDYSSTLDSAPPDLSVPSAWPPPPVRPTTTGTLRRVLDAQGQLVARYDYNTTAAAQPVALRADGKAIPAEARGEICSQLCGETRSVDPIFGNARAWGNNQPTNICDANGTTIARALAGQPAFQKNCTTDPATGQFTCKYLNDNYEFKFGKGENLRRADCEAVRGGSHACVEYLSATQPQLFEGKSYQQRLSLCNTDSISFGGYQQCQTEVSENEICGGSGLTTIGKQCTDSDCTATDSGITGPAAVAQCKTQCETAYGPQGINIGGQTVYGHLYGHTDALYYNLTKVYNSQGNVEVENTYETNPYNFELDRVTYQIVNEGQGAYANKLATDTIDIEYFDLERLGDSTGHAQVKARSSFGNEDRYVCDDFLPNGGCMSWVTETAAAPLPSLATRTRSSYDEFTVVYLDDRGQLLQEDRYASGTATAPSSSVVYRYDANGNVINALSASGTRQLRYFDPGFPGRLLSETLVATDGVKTVHTEYRYDANGKLSDTFAYDADQALISRTRLIRDSLQRIVSTEVRYSADDNGPATGTTYRYGEAELGLEPDQALAEASWYRAGGKTYVHSIVVRSGFEAQLGAFGAVETYDAKGRELGPGEDPTEVIAGDALVGTELQTFDTEKRVVDGSDVPDRISTAIDYDPSRRPIGTLTAVQTAPGVWREVSSFTSYCEIDQTTGDSKPGTCGPLPKALHESWVNPVSGLEEGRVTSYQYDALNQVFATTVSPRGSHLYFVHDAANSRTTCRSLGWDGRELALVNAEGEWTEYVYDSLGRRVATQQGYKQEVPVWAKPCEAAILGTNGKTQWEETERVWYDNYGRVGFRAVAGLITSYYYDSFGRVVGETDPQGRNTRRGYDAQGRLTWEAVYRAGATTSYTKPSAATAGLLSFTETGYDPRGRVVAATSWDLDAQEAMVTTTQYADAQRQVTVTAPTGLFVVTKADALGRTTFSASEGDAGNLSTATTVYSWAENSATTTTQDNLGTRVLKSYSDGNGQVRDVYEGAILLSSRTNDVFGRPVQVRPRGLNEQTTVYNAFGEIASQKQDATLSKTVSDPQVCGPAPATCVTEEPSSLLTTYGYDKVGRRTAVRQYTISEDYNPLNDTDAKTTIYAYDGLGRVTTITDPDGRARSMTYEARTVAGLDVPQATASVETIDIYGGDSGTGLHVEGVFDYDPATGRLMSETFSPQAGANVLQAEIRREWTYDDCASYSGAGACGYGRVIRGSVSHTAVNGYAGPLPVSVTSENRYDRRGRLVDTWNSLGNVHAIHGYDVLGESITTQVGNSVVTHRFSEAGQLQDIGLQVNGGANQTLATYHYSGNNIEAGALLSANYGDGSADHWSYDGLRRPTQLQVKAANGDVLASRRDVYGTHGIALMREHQFRINGVLQTTGDLFRVDEAGRLIAERNGLTGLQLPILGDELTLDSDLYTQHVGPQILRASGSQFGPNWRRYHLDGRGNWTARESQDASFNTWQAGVQSNDANAYTGFTLRNLASATGTSHALSLTDEGDTTRSPSYVPGSTTDAVEFTYDLFDHPLTLTRVTNGSAVQSVKATYDAFGHRVMEDTGSQKNYFLWSGDEIVAFGASTGSAPGAGSYNLRVIGTQLDSTVVVLQNLGSGVHIYSHQWSDGSTLATTLSGALEDGIRYTAWGEIAQSTGGLATYAPNRRWLWKGAMYDAVTRTYTMRAREFSPQWGRFLSNDPIGQAGGLNVYAFGMGRSDLRDPRGLKAATSASGTAVAPSTSPHQINGPKLSCPLCESGFGPQATGSDPNAPAQPPAGSDDSLDDIFGPVDQKKVAEDRQFIDNTLQSIDRHFKLDAKSSRFELFSDGNSKFNKREVNAINARSPVVLYYYPDGKPGLITRTPDAVQPSLRALEVLKARFDAEGNGTGPTFEVIATDRAFDRGGVTYRSSLDPDHSSFVLVSETLSKLAFQLEPRLNGGHSDFEFNLPSVYGHEFTHAIRQYSAYERLGQAYAVYFENLVREAEGLRHQRPYDYRK